MSRINKEVTKCPECHKEILCVVKVKEDNRICGYSCSSCGSTFDHEYFIDFSEKCILHLAKLRNPDYVCQLKSEDPYKNLEIIQELDSEGSSFHSKIYIIKKIPL